MNETYYLKIIGKVNIPQRLEIGHNYKLICDSSITQEQKIDNEDGTFSVIFKVEPITVEISKDNGKIIRARDPRKNSVKIRNTFFREHGFLTDPMEFETLYDKCTTWIIQNAPMIVDEVIKGRS